VTVKISPPNLIRNTLFPKDPSGNVRDTVSPAKPSKKHAVPDLWQATGADKDNGWKRIEKLLPDDLRECAP